MSSTQTLVESEPSIQRPLEGEPSAKLQLRCHQWMYELWRNLRANLEAQDACINMAQTKILGEKIGYIQPNLAKELARKRCNLARLLDNRPLLHRHHRALQEKAEKVKINALATIHEDPALNAEDATTFVEEDTCIMGQGIAPGVREVPCRRLDQCFDQIMHEEDATMSLVGSQDCGRNGMLTAKGDRPISSDLKCLSAEAAVMLSITSNVTEYTRHLDGSLLDASLRPGLSELVGMLNSFQENQCQIGLSYVPNVVLRHHQWHIHQSLEKGALTSPVVFSVLSFAILSHFGKRIKDHMEKRV